MCRNKLFALTLCAFVTSLVTGPTAQAADPALIAWWKLNDGAGTVALDSSGYENHGTVMNPDAGLGTGGSAWFNDPERGMVISFNGADGSGAYIHTDVIIPAQTMDNGFTWVFWAKQAAAQATNNDVIMGNRYGGTASPLQFVKFTPTRFENYNDDGSYVNGINYTSIPADVWIHHALVKDGAELTYYRDGVVMLTNTMAKTVDANPFYMGADGFAGAAENWQGYLSDVRLYERALSAKEVQDAMAGKGPISQTATDPAPAHEATDVPRDIVLRWTAGEYAQTHDVYFGTAADDVLNASRAEPMGVLLSQSQTPATYDPPEILELGQTYYWRVDEVNAAPDNTIFKGELWSFTAEPVAYAIENVIATSNGASDQGTGPERTIDGSGLNADDQHSVESADMWLAKPGDDPLWIHYEFDRVYKLHEMLVWNYNSMFELILGFGLKDVTVEYSEDGTDWISLGDIVLAQATARATYAANTAVDFGGVPARYVRLTVNSAYGGMGQYGLSEVRFLFIPAHAREPQPADGAAGIDPEATLSWRAGREAASHEVYRGTEPNDLPLVATVDQAVYAPGNLEFGSTYYWQIVEVNEADEIAAWAGDVWTFSTREYALIDGFETYDDDIDAGTTIFDTWLDGWVNDTGSTVGYFDAPFAERTIVRSGSQSMPLQYDNSSPPFYSEAEREFATAQDWTGNGADTLVLYVRGNAPDFVATANGDVVMSAIGTDIWGTADQFRYAYRTLNGNGSITARVDSLDATPNGWAKCGVMIRQSTEPGAVNTLMALTGGEGGGATYQQRMTSGGESVSQHTYADGPLAPPYWVRVTREGNTLLGYTSADGENWTQRGDTVTLAMTDPVLIGLALTSHNAAQATSAEFSSIGFTGNVSAAWQIAAIGVAQPEGNSSEPMYVTIEDASGSAATVTNPDEAVTVRPSWQEWAIPYSDLSGVNLSRVRAMTIGVGSVTSPSAGGTGTVYIDDIGFGRPVAE